MFCKERSSIFAGAVESKFADGRSIQSEVVYKQVIILLR